MTQTGCWTVSQLLNHWLQASSAELAPTWTTASPLHTGKTQCWGLLLLSKARNFTWRYFPCIYFPGLGDLQRSPGWRRVTGYPSLRNGEMSETCFPWNPVLHFERPQLSSVSAGHLSASPFILLYISDASGNGVVLVGRFWYHCLHKGLWDSSPGNCCRLKAPWLWVCRPENSKEISSWSPHKGVVNTSVWFPLPLVVWSLSPLHCSLGGSAGWWYNFYFCFRK